MRLPDSGAAPWLAGLPSDASPAAIALAKQLWESGARPDANGAWTAGPSPTHYTPPNLSAPPPAYDAATANAVGVGPAPGLAGPAAPDPANDPAYQALLAQLTRQRHDAVVGFGDPTGTGADAATAAEAAANPYSTTAELGHVLHHNLGGINTAANAHGALYSGANLTGQQHELAAGQQRTYNARKALLDQLNALSGQQTSGYFDAYNRMAGSV